MVDVLALLAEALSAYMLRFHLIVVVLDVHALVPLMRDLLMFDAMALGVDILKLF